MINYYFSQFIKKKSDWTGPWTVPSRPVEVRHPGANDGTSSIFSNLDRLGPFGFRPDRPGSDRLQNSNCSSSPFKIKISLQSV
jgi:hypothetical protein